MKELLKHLPAIKKFVEERTQAFQELSDNTVKNFLREAYKLPFLFPVRIIVSEEKFVNFLFDMRKDLFDGKNIFFTSEPSDINKNSAESIKNEDIAVENTEPRATKEKKVKKNSSNAAKQEKLTNQEIVGKNSKKAKKVTPKNTTKTSTSTIKTNTQRTTAQTKKVKA